MASRDSSTRFLEVGSDSGQEAEPAQQSQPDLVIDNPSEFGFIHGTYWGKRIVVE